MVLEREEVGHFCNWESFTCDEICGGEGEQSEEGKGVEVIEETN
jgi:hypothetical protein